MYLICECPASPHLQINVHFAANARTVGQAQAATSITRHPGIDANQNHAYGHFFNRGEVIGFEPGFSVYAPISSMREVAKGVQRIGFRPFNTAMAPRIYR